MDVLANVEYGLRVKKVPRAERRERAKAALESVQLGDYAARRPTQLSGGQRQRVALARALVNRPKVLLLDEPLGALDLKLRREMQLELKQIQREVGITFVFVTHDQEEALTMSDRIAVFSDGRIEQVATPGRALREPGLAVRRRLRRHLQPAGGRGGRSRPRPAGCLQHPAREDPPRRRRSGDGDAHRTAGSCRTWSTSARSTTTWSSSMPGRPSPCCARTCAAPRDEAMGLRGQRVTVGWARRARRRRSDQHGATRSSTTRRRSHEEINDHPSRDGRGARAGAGRLRDVQRGRRRRQRWRTGSEEQGGFTAPDVPMAE